MKVPKMYKSSDRYNAGTDVIYNDDSKLQYAPFIYATTGSGDDGGDGGDDEEGEDTMVVHMSVVEGTGTLDKSWTEISTALGDDKIVMIVNANEGGYSVCYVTNIGTFDSSDPYFVNAITEADGAAVMIRFLASTADGVLTMFQSND